MKIPWKSVYPRKTQTCTAECYSRHLHAGEKEKKAKKKKTKKNIPFLNVVVIQETKLRFIGKQLHKNKKKRHYAKDKGPREQKAFVTKEDALRANNV